MTWTTTYLILILTIGGCAPGERSDRVGTSEHSDSSVDAPGLFSGRIALISLETDDSSSVATAQIVDQMLAQGFDSLPSIEYLTLEATGLLQAEEGGIVQEKIGELDVTGIVAVRIARLGSIVGVDFRLFDPESGDPIYHDRAFSFVRFRDQEGSLLFGPALYEALYRHVLLIGERSVGSMPDGREVIAAAKPLVVGSVEVSSSSSLGRISEERRKISRDAIRALSDFVSVKSSAFVVFDYNSRSQLYNLVGLDMVDDLEPVGNIERQAMYNVDVPYFLTARVEPDGTANVRIEVSLHQITGLATDTVVVSHENSYDSQLFQTSAVEKDLISEILVVAERVVADGSEFVWSQP